MALISPEELIVLLDLPADTQPTDRAQLVCDLVLDKVAEAAQLASAAGIVAPYPAGAKAIALTAAARLYENPVALRSSNVNGEVQVYANGIVSVLTEDERDALARVFGTATGTSPNAPRYSFPDWDWSWTTSPTSALAD